MSIGPFIALYLAIGISFAAWRYHWAVKRGYTAKHDEHVLIVFAAVIAAIGWPLIMVLHAVDKWVPGGQKFNDRAMTARLNRGPLGNLIYSILWAAFAALLILYLTAR